MKNLVKLVTVVAVLLCCMISTSVEAKSKKEMVEVSIQTDVDCPTCEAKIMNVIPFQRGVKLVEVDLKSGVVKVKYDPTKSSEKTIKESLQRINVKVIEEAEEEQ